MELQGDVLVSPWQEVSVLEGELVATIRELASRGVGSKTIAQTVGLAPNTVPRYLRQPVETGVQTRPRARRLTDAARAEARGLYEGAAEGNAVVVHGLLGERWSTSACGRSSEPSWTFARRGGPRLPPPCAWRRRPATSSGSISARNGWRSAANRPGVLPRGRVELLSPALCQSLLNERQDDWREGIAAAFTHFGGVPRTILGDNARALVSGRDRSTGTVAFHPAYLAFCRDWDVQPRALAPYRARTKGKTEAGVKYVKRNAVAGLTFPSFGALERHLPPGWSSTRV